MVTVIIIRVWSYFSYTCLILLKSLGIRMVSIVKTDFLDHHFYWCVYPLQGYHHSMPRWQPDKLLCWFCGVCNHRLHGSWTSSTHWGGCHCRSWFDVYCLPRGHLQDACPTTMGRPILHHVNHGRTRYTVWNVRDVVQWDSRCVPKQIGQAKDVSHCHGSLRHVSVRSAVLHSCWHLHL